MELRPSQVERIRRYEMSRNSKAAPEPTNTQRADAILVWFGLGIAFLILACILIVTSEWQPGEQERIAREYRALRHDAVAMGDWK